MGLTSLVQSVMTSDVEIGVARAAWQKGKRTMQASIIFIGFKADMY
jgi:hypothetical protein